MTTILRSFEIRLEQPALFTRSSATMGTPESLDYIPGGAILGVVAARLYDELPTTEAFTLFHSGAVRFGDARPLTMSGAPTLPVPLCLSMPKGATPERGDPLPMDLVANDIRTGPATGSVVGPPKQLREGFLGPTLEFVRPRFVSSLRTALQPDGRPQDGLLFGLHAVSAGTRFGCTISFDNSAAHLADKVNEALVSAPIHLGRSRSAEFGRSHARSMDTPQWSSAAATKGEVVLLAISDLALRDPDTAAPTLRPTAAALGLDASLGLRWRPERSFIRARSYSPYNAHRRRPGLERQVIVAGSVLVYESTAGANPEAIAGALSAGVGDHREQGLGALLLEPVLIAGEGIQADQVLADATPATSGKPPVAAPELPTDPLFAWLVSENEAGLAAEQAYDLAIEWEGDMAQCRPPLPASQWGSFRALMWRARDLNHAIELLFDHKTGFTRTGVGKRKDQWGARCGKQTRADCLEGLVQSTQHDAAVRFAALRQLPSRMVKANRARRSTS